MQSHGGHWSDDRVRVQPAVINNHNCSEAWRLHELRIRKTAIGLKLYVSDVKDSGVGIWQAKHKSRFVLCF